MAKDPFHLVRTLISRPLLQPLWLGLLKLSHMGMNYGGGQDPRYSGEISAAAQCLNGLADANTLVIFDVGAHEGAYSALLSARLRHPYQIFCFEPQRACCDKIKARFGSRQEVVVECLGLGSRSETRVLQSNGSGTATASIRRSLDVDSTGTTILIASVDAYCADNSIERIHLLKIDTEGFEVEVLQGAQQMINSGRVELIQFEFGETFLGSGYSLRSAFELLTERFDVYRILRRSMKRVEYSVDLEVYKIANFLCVRRS